MATQKVATCFLGIVLVLALAFPTAGSVTAEIPGSPWFTIFPEQAVVEGWGWPLEAAIHLTIDDPANIGYEVEKDGIVIADPWSSDGTWLWIDFSDTTYKVKPGDVVTLTDGINPQSHTVQNLAITQIDPIENQVFGTADPGSVITLWSWEDPESRRIYTDGSGEWGVDFDDIGFDLVPGNHVRAEIWIESNDTAVDWEVPQPQSVWRDDFDGSLAAGWTWMFEYPSKWSLEVNPGYLRIYAAGVDPVDENMLLRPVAQGDFAIETHVFFEPDTNFQAAGLIIEQDEGNRLALVRAFCDVPDICVGNGIYFDQVLNGGWGENNFATQVNSPNEAYLRLERRGELVRGLFSYEGITWFEIGTQWIPPNFQVNGVGLVAFHDFYTPDLDIPADFDYFELTEGWGFLPEGYHDGDAGNVPAWACTANGWAADPDDRSADLAIELNVDGQSLPDWLFANQYREDLDSAGVCVDGRCSFSTSLWGTIAPYQAHTIVAYAQDVPSGDWVQLSASPKELTCRTYDIYTFDPLTGETKQITNLPDSDEYSPSWSPNGKQMAHDVIYPDAPQAVYITDLNTGMSTPLTGAGEGGNDPSWSPNGKWIAFDRAGTDTPHLYVVPAAGGDPVFTRENASSADWSPNGKRLVFVDLTDGSIRTTLVDGIRSAEVTVVPNGLNPAWSPDGKWIAFEANGGIWKVRMNPFGSPVGQPVQLTSGSFWDGHPTWSPDGTSIVYHSGFNDDWDLWSVPAEGGMGTWLTGGTIFGDYDPDYGRNNPVLAYASSSPDGQAPRSWGVAYTVDAGTWDAGEHTYQFWAQGAPSSDERFFTVTDEAPQYDGYALLRPGGIRVTTPEGCPTIETIHPEQETRFHAGWGFDGSYPDAVVYYASLMAQVRWDTSELVNMVPHQIFPFTPPFDWQGYVCTFTGK